MKPANEQLSLTLSSEPLDEVHCATSSGAAQLGGASGKSTDD